MKLRSKDSSKPARTRLWWGLLGGTLFCAIFLWRWPAATVGVFAERLCAGQCRIVDSAGTLWSGRGRFYAADATQRWHDLGALRWSLSLAGLHLSLGDGELSLGRENGHWSLIGRSLAVPAALALGAPPLGLPPAGWQGLLLLEDGRFEFPGAGAPAGHFRLRWLGAASALLDGIPLGDFMAEGSIAAGALQAELTGGRADLGLHGQLRLEAKNDGMPRLAGLAGELRLSPTLDARLGRHVALLFPPAGTPGNYRLQAP